MPLTNLDGADIAGMYLCFCAVVIHEGTNTLEDVIGLCIADMLMPANGAMRLYDDAGKHGAMPHQILAFQNVMDFYTALAISQTFYGNNSLFFNHDDSPLFS